MEVAYNQSDFDYRRQPGVNQSSLKKIIVSPAHYQAALKQKFHPSPAMEMGTAVHAWVLDGEEVFNSQYVEQPDHVKLNTKAGKEWKDAQGRKKILKPEMVADIKGMAASLQRCSWYENTGADYIKRNEVSVYWEWMGVQCKARLDSLLVEEGLVLDLKTTASVDPDQFLRKVTGLGYDFQAAYYAKAAEVAFGKPFRFTFAAIEREAPYDFQLFPVSDEMMQEGLAKCEDALQIYAQCEKTGEWPERAVKSHQLRYPRWHKPYQRQFTPIEEDLF